MAAIARRPTTANERGGGRWLRVRGGLRLRGGEVLDDRDADAVKSMRTRSVSMRTRSDVHEDTQRRP